MLTIDVPRYRIMAVMETGELTCFANNLTDEDTDHWLLANTNNYPDLKFFAEREEPCNGYY